MLRRALPFVVLSALLIGCPRTPPPKLTDVVIAPPKAESSRQGLTKAEHDEFHHLSKGSELIPLAWLQALESAATGKPFLANVERFGLIADLDNADGLPIGLT